MFYLLNFLLYSSTSYYLGHPFIIIIELKILIVSFCNKLEKTKENLWKVLLSSLHLNMELVIFLKIRTFQYSIIKNTTWTY